MKPGFIPNFHQIWRLKQPEVSRFRGGQFGAKMGGQFAPNSGGQLGANWGGQYEGIFQ